MKKYKVTYSDLVLNTLLDAMKRENRYTIDTLDVMNYEKVIKEFITAYDIPMEIEGLDNRKIFLGNIEKYVQRGENVGLETYTLLPWITNQEFESALDDSIFSKDDMDKVLAYTSRYLRFVRNYQSIAQLNNITHQVDDFFLQSTKKDIESLEKQKNKAQDRLYMIKSRLGIKE